MNPEMEARFNELVKIWQNDFGLSLRSDPCAVLDNRAYLEIISMGKDVLPLIFKDYDKTGAPWAIALRSILCGSPVKPESRGKANKVREDWLAWARENGYLNK